MEWGNTCQKEGPVHSRAVGLQTPDRHSQQERGFTGSPTDGCGIVEQAEGGMEEKAGEINRFARMRTDKHFRGPSLHQL